MLGMGILMPQIDEATCFARGGQWAPIEGLPDWALSGNTAPAPTPTP